MISPYIAPGITHSKDRILIKIAAIYKLEVKDLYIKTRVTRIVEPRQISIAIMKHACKMANNDLSLEFNQSDSNIVHARKCVMNFYSNDRNFRKRVDDILEAIFPFQEERAMILNKMLDPNMDKALVGLNRTSKELPIDNVCNN
jgi:hypothetical protein